LLGGYLGVILLGGTLIALGLFISSLVENQIVAAVVTFGLFLLLWVLDVGVRGSTAWWSQALQYISILRHFDDFTRGIVDTSSTIFYLSAMVLGLFLTLRSLDALRWRRA
jgi:ABC-2 type transport system permease protein